MIEPVSIRGLWWLPGHEVKRAPGLLTLSADEFSLALTDSLDPEVAPGSGPGWIELPIVLGTSEDRKTDMTLLECGGSVWGLPAETISETWYPTATLVGENLEHEHDVLFDQVLVNVRGLDAWAGTPNVNPEFVHDPALGLTGSISADISREELAVAHLPDGLVRLQITPRFVGRGVHADIGRDTWFQIEPTHAVGWRAVLDDWVAPLRDLLTLATTEPSSILEVRMRSATSCGRPRWVELLIQTLDLGRPPTRVPSRAMLFDRATIPGGFDTGLNRWWEIRARYELGLDRFFSVSHAPFIYDQDRFVSYANAVEAMHAVDLGKPVLAEEERDERVTRALASIDPDLRDWATPLLEESLPPYARHRLLEYINEAAPVGDELIGADADAFASRVVVTRNYLTHLTPSLKKKALQPPDRYWHAEALAWIIRAVLLRRLGTSSAEMEQMVSKHRGFRGVASHVAGFGTDTKP